MGGRISEEIYKARSNMKVLILAGGIGKRMVPFKTEKYKIKFLGTEIIKQKVEELIKLGLNDIIVVCNPVIQENLKNILQSGVKIIIQPQPLGMANAILCAKEILKTDDVLIVNPNDIFEPSIYHSILTEYKNSSFDSYILAYKVQKYFPGGYLRTENSEIKEIIEKPQPGHEPSNLVNIVVHLHRDIRKLIEYLEKTSSEKDDVYEKSISQMMKDGFRFKAVEYTGFWGSIKYPWDILNIKNYYMERRVTYISNLATISEKSIIEGPVIIDDNVKIYENTKIKGPCYIGKNTIIGNNCLIRENTHIGSDCLVGNSTEIRNSYIGDNCKFHMNYVGDSILEGNILMGAGAITANFRFDEKNIFCRIGNEIVNTNLNKFGCIIGKDAKIGVNTSIMPGIKIGSNSIIGPGIVLTEDIGDNKKVFIKHNLSIR